VSQSEYAGSHNRKSRFTIAGTLAGGLIIAITSWFLRDIDAWWSALLANIAVVALLLAPGEYLLARLRAGFARIERAADRANVTADAAKKTAEETARSLDDVRQALIERQLKEHESELDIYRAIARDPSREALLHGLRHATESDIITPAGVRSPIWETNLHYRYVIDESRVLEVRLETDRGDVISSHRWESGVSAEDFDQTLVQAVREANWDLGVGLNDPTESIKDLSEMLTEVADLRSQELLGHRSTLRRIIERVDGWYFTEENVLPADNLHYAIGVNRLDESDWEEHLRQKGWWGAVTAIPFARRLYRIDQSSDPTTPRQA
jgi:hypothetical protein